MPEKNLVEEALVLAKGDTYVAGPDQWERQCMGRVWTLIRDRLESAGQKEAARLVHEWCEPDWVRDARKKE